MSGDVRGWNYPVLSDGDKHAVNNKEKAKMLVDEFVNIHSSNNLSVEGKKGESTKSKNMEALKKEVFWELSKCPF